MEKRKEIRKEKRKEKEEKEEEVKKRKGRRTKRKGRRTKRKRTSGEAKQDICLNLKQYLRKEDESRHAARLRSFNK